MDQLTNYFFSPEFASFLQTTGVPIILTTMLLSFLALLYEIRLPIRYYWGLPGHTVRSVLRGIGLMRKVKPWGRCFDQETSKPLSLVACELLDESTKRLVVRTYSNHAGEFGFRLLPGRYLLRAVKSWYRMPSYLDPENVEVYEVDESFVLSVAVMNKELVPSVNLPLVPVKKTPELTGMESFWHYTRMFIFQLANGLLILDVVLALLGFWTKRDPFYGIVIAVAVVLLFIKLYILETISVLAKASHA